MLSLGAAAVAIKYTKNRDPIDDAADADAAAAAVDDGWWWEVGAFYRKPRALHANLGFTPHHSALHYTNTANVNAKHDESNSLNFISFDLVRCRRRNIFITFLPTTERPTVLPPSRLPLISTRLTNRHKQIFL